MIGKDTNPKDQVATNKVPLWLLSPIAKAKWALAQFAGMAKYGAWNWRIAGVRSSVYLSAAQRHLDAYLSGEEYDPIDGTDHLGNIMACCAILLDAREAGKLTDDRPPSVDIRATYGEMELLAACLRDKYADKNPRHYTIADTEGACPPVESGLVTLDEDELEECPPTARSAGNDLVAELQSVLSRLESLDEPGSGDAGLR